MTDANTRDYSRCKPLTVWREVVGPIEPREFSEVVLQMYRGSVAQFVADECAHLSLKQRAIVTDKLLARTRRRR